MKKWKRDLIIALISAGSGIIIALIGSEFFIESKNNDNNKYHVKITDIHLENDIDIEGIRVICRINGSDFSYPNTSFVVEPQYYIPNQYFEIENKNGFDCYFEVVVLDNLCHFHYLRPFNSLVINGVDFNYSGIYNINLFENIDGQMNDSINLKCLIEFKIY